MKNIFSLHNKLCMGLNHDNDVVMMKKQLGNDSQLWQWHEGNCLINKDGYALDVKGTSAEPGKFNFNLIQNRRNRKISRLLTSQI